MAQDHDVGIRARIPNGSGRDGVSTPHEARTRMRSALLERIDETPDAYVHVVEARSEGGGSVVVHVASKLKLANAWCKNRPASDFSGGTRYHVVPHPIDAPDDHPEIEMAVYGVRDGGRMVEDLIDDD